MLLRSSVDSSFHIVLRHSHPLFFLFLSSCVDSMSHIVFPHSYPLLSRSVQLHPPTLDPTCISFSLTLVYFSSTQVYPATVNSMPSATYGVGCGRLRMSCLALVFQSRLSRVFLLPLPRLILPPQLSLSLSLISVFELSLNLACSHSHCYVTECVLACVSSSFPARLVALPFALIPTSQPLFAIGYHVDWCPFPLSHVM